MEYPSDYEIIYDYSDPSDPNAYEWHGLHETFNGTWSELQRRIAELKQSGCFNVSASNLAIQ